MLLQFYVIKRHFFSFYNGTAESYFCSVSFFDSIGQALKQLPREKIQLATKFGIIGLDFSNLQIKGTPDYVRSSCEASLKRLDIEYIDLYYQHRVDT